MSDRYAGRHKPSRQTSRLAAGITAVLVALLLVAGALSLSHRSGPQTAPVDLVLPIGAPTELGQWCVDHNTAAFRATLTSAGRNLLKGCVELWGVGLVPSPSPSGSPTPTPSATQSPSPTPSPSATTPSPSSSVSPTATTAPPTTPPATTPPPSPSPTVSPSPSPTIGPTSRTCAPFPAMPDAACTGPQPGTVFKSCPNLLSPNTVYDSCLWQNTNVLGAKGAVVRNSRLVGGVMMLGYDSSLGMVITDTEIDGTGYNDPASYAAIGQSGYTCVRCNIHHTGMGARYDFNVTIRDSWLHDFRQLDPGAHMSGIGSNGGSHNAIEHNVIDCPMMACSGAMVAYGDFHPVSDLLARNNLFNSPGSFCLYAGSTPNSGKPYPVATDMRYIDNLWGRKYDPGPKPGQSGPRCGQFGPVSPGTWQSGGSSVWTGNRWQDGSGPVNP